MREGPHAGMDMVILDLEWNGAYSRRLKGHINEIIEFGAVKLSGEDLSVAGTFRAFVRPQVGKKLSDIISSLTNITDADLEEGISYTQAVSRFRKWMGRAVLMTWGTSDILTLIENCRYFCGSERIPFLQEYADLQCYCESVLPHEEGKQLGLAPAAELLGIDPKGMEHHRALDDSLLAAECLRRVYPRADLRPFLQDGTKQEFYDRIQFRTVVICDLEHPLIQRADLSFSCEQCGKRAHRDEPWQLKNKSFRARFTCGGCGRRFVGRVQFKLKYDGLVVKKAVLPWEEPKPEPEEKGDQVL